MANFDREYIKSLLCDLADKADFDNIIFERQFQPLKGGNLDGCVRLKSFKFTIKGEILIDKEEKPYIMRDLGDGSWEKVYL